MPPQFEYSGIDGFGQRTRGVAQGDSPMDIVLALKSEGIRVYSLKRKLLPARLKLSKKISSSDLSSFNAQLAALLNTSLPLSESLRNLCREMKGGRFKAVIGRISAELDAGQSFSESLAEHADYFPPLYISMVAAGERSGDLPGVLYEAASHFKSVDELNRKFTNVLVYPVMLSLLAAGVLVTLLKLMAPPYIEIYSGFQLEFPLSLKFIVGLERFLRMELLGAVIAVVVAGIGFFLGAKRSAVAGGAFERLMFRIPVWGEMMKQALLLESISGLAILVRSGVPLHESLKVVEGLTTNRVLGRAFANAADGVAEGQSLSQSLLKQAVFPIEVAWLVRTGESSGDLVGAFEESKQLLQRKFELHSRMVFSVLEPGLLVGLGVVIIAIVVSLFYPMYALSKYLGV